MSARRVTAAVFVAATALYASVGWWLQVRHGFILGDALARTSAAQSVVFSRDPHLAAIGFVFTPLTAMLELPAVLLAPVLPEMVSRAFAGSLMSAVFMAGAVVQLLSFGRDRGLPGGFVGAVTALVALNPLIVFYGSNGMSEAPFVFFTLWAARRLTAWVDDDDVHHLVLAGFLAMGLAYLTRYDAVAVVAAAGLAVGLITLGRAPRERRWRAAGLDVVMVSGPGLLTFVGWAAASWLITGDAFAQFGSQYGNAAILEQTGGARGGGLGYAAGCVALLAPTLVPLTVWAGVLRWRGAWRPMAMPLALVGSVLAFQAVSSAAGSTYAFLRFFIVAVPLAAVVALLAVPDGPLRPAARPGRRARAAAMPPARGPGRVWAATVVVVLAVSLPTTAWAMQNPAVAPQEYALAAVYDPRPDSVDPRAATERRIAATFSTERRIAAYLDGLDLPAGSVVTDTVFGFAVVAASRRPRTFVIPSDPDFVAALDDPAAAGVQYLLAVPPTGRGVSDALNRRFPTLYATGADVATLEIEVPNDGDGQPDWRIYRVDAVTAEA